jgi:hypothetical protein
MVENNDQQRFVLVTSRKPFSCSGCRRMQPENTERLFDNARLVNGFPKCYCSTCAAQLQDYTENPDQKTGVSASLSGNQPANQCNCTCKAGELEAALKRIAELEDWKAKAFLLIQQTFPHQHLIDKLTERVAALEAKAAPASEPAWFEQIPPT